MAENERLGASFSIDITNLRAGLTQANKLIKESESEFKAASAGLDKFGDSQAIAQAKIKNLTDVTEIQQKKVDALKSEYKRLISEGMDPASNQAVELRTKINNEEAALKKNQAELKRQTAALEEMESASDDAGDSIEDTGRQAEKSGEGFTIAKGAIANLIANGLTAMVSACKNAISSLSGLSESTREYREGLNQLQTAFQLAGFSAEDTYQAFNYFGSVLGDTRKAQETMLMLSQLTKNEQELVAWTDTLTGVYAMFGKAIPTESLTEAINHTVQLGEQVEGTLADALEWGGVNLEDFNVKLKECNTEEERASLIQGTLNDLYGEAAEKYNELNKDILDASTASTDFENAQAQIGAAIEPVTTKITNLKTEFLKGLTPVIQKEVIPAVNGFIDQLKKDGTISKFSTSVSNLAKKILPPLSKALKFLAENFETIVKVTYTAVTTFAAFNAALKISSAIKAAQTAMSALSAATSAATVAQTGLNAAMSANPIGAVITAVGLLVSGLMLLGGAEEEVTEATDVLSESQRATVTAAQEAAKAYLEEKQAAEELAGAQIANVDYVKNNLLPQLQDVIDANGDVKSGEEERAQFILNELNNALGTEYSSLSEIVDANGKIKDSIYEVINAKKAQILLEAYENSYRDAITKVSEAEIARAENAQGLAKAQADLAEKQAALTEAENEFQAALETGNIAYAESFVERRDKAQEAYDVAKTTLDNQTTAYNESNAAVQGYYRDINSYERASTLVMQGETGKAITLLGNLGTGFKTVSSTAQLSANEQKKVLEQQVIDTEVNLKLMEEDYKTRSKNMTDEEKAQAEARLANAKQQADDAKAEFYKVGGNITQGIADGSEEKGWILNNKLSTLINSALDAARKAADSHSPSRKFKKLVGWTIGQGIALGIDETTKDVVKSIRKQSAEMEKAYNINGISASVDAGLNLPNNTGSGSTSTQKGNVVVYQTNNYSQAHSRYELYKSKQQTAAAVRLALGV